MTKFNAAFWKWFGDSKVVDANGDPLVVYHGSPNEAFNVFRTGIGAHFGSLEQAFTRLSEVAPNHLKKLDGEEWIKRGYVRAFYLSIQNPLRVDDISDFDSSGEVSEEIEHLNYHARGLHDAVIDAVDGGTGSMEEAEERGFKIIREWLTDNGYDGFVYKNESEGSGDSYAVFSPNQIKSIDNRGTWDADDPVVTNPPKKIGRAVLEYGHIASDYMKPVLMLDGVVYGPDDVIDGFPAGSHVVTIISGQTRMDEATIRAAKRFVGQSVDSGIRWIETIERWEKSSADDADDPDIRHNPPMKSDDRAEKIARIKALKEAVRPLVEKGNLTASEATRFEGYMREISTLRYSIAKPWTTTEKIPSQEVRKSALPSEIILVARNELLLNPLVYGAIEEAAFGVHLNADTAVDRVMGDHDPQVSAQEFYDTFSGTREALRRYFGDTMVLYRAVGLRKKKLTTNWASTDAIARQYGDRVVTERFPVDSVVAVNVSLSGTYEELIVISDPLTTG